MQLPKPLLVCGVLLVLLVAFESYIGRAMGQKDAKASARVETGTKEIRIVSQRAWYSKKESTATAHAVRVTMLVLVPKNMISAKIDEDKHEVDVDEAAEEDEDNSEKRNKKRKDSRKKEQERVII